MLDESEVYMTGVIFTVLLFGFVALVCFYVAKALKAHRNGEGVGKALFKGLLVLMAIIFAIMLINVMMQ